MKKDGGLFYKINKEVVERQWNEQKKGYKSPSSAKEKYPYELKMIWSRTLMSRKEPAALIFVVISSSALDGFSAPDGWLCARIREQVFTFKAAAKISLVSAIVPVMPREEIL